MVGTDDEWIELAELQEATAMDWWVFILTRRVYVHATLEVDFYSQSCPSVEKIVRSVITKAYYNDSRIAPALIRMHFHDSFVRGCDGSILLDSTPGHASEKEAIPNQTIRGYEVIDEAKAMVESQCPSTVSCADILAFAARDSTTLASKKILYQVASGRRDGRISLENEVATNLPSQFFNATQLISNFKSKNLTAEDLVILTGAHSIGVAHCEAFINRLYNYSAASGTDPTLDPVYAARLKRKCPSNTTNSSSTVALDSLTPKLLDNMFYVGLMKNLGLLSSDQALLTEEFLRIMWKRMRTMTNCGNRNLVKLW
ncbi:peroxidase 5-like [Papaver somniferum]|uniref:peroxidase 5-like n=1 Tax=Papaver somniferum TaxID=3469 RepID=UPI000E6F9946|nr:peroxidase 5-like [Papaver somniferum]